MSLNIPRHLLDEIIDRARADAPDECWGLLAGKGDDVAAVFHLANGAPPDERPFRYTVEPRSFMQASDEIGDRNWDILGIYHSHTHTQPYPSPTDIEHANPDLGDIGYLIVSLRAENQPFVFRGMNEEDRRVANAFARHTPAQAEVQLWHIRDNRAWPAALNIVENASHG